MDYEPRRITYEQLMRVFWSSHTPTRRAWTRQYMSIIFYHNEEQKMLALSTKEQEETRRKSRIFTEIVPASTFYLAEDYHQKYWLRQVPELMREFREMYPDFADIVNSTAAARINGFIGGYGSPGTLRTELDSYGLSPAGQRKLLEIGRELESVGNAVEAV